MKVKGKVHAIGQTREVSAKFKTREIVLMTEDKFPQLVPFQLSQDKCDLGDNIKVGDIVEVSFNLRGREWKSPQGEIKYFLTLDIWTMVLSTETPQFNPKQYATAEANKMFSKDIVDSYAPEEDDDLPF